MITSGRENTKLPPRTQIFFNGLQKNEMLASEIWPQDCRMTAWVV
uniref:Uncharacterized protein n=1 Tax=Arundo donax TaxID=35708 RepID=A0A0A9GLM8_ARUDO